MAAFNNCFFMSFNDMQDPASWSQQEDQTQQPGVEGDCQQEGNTQQQSVVGARLRFEPNEVQPQAPSCHGYTAPTGLPMPMPQVPADNYWIQEQYAHLPRFGVAPAQDFWQPVPAQQQGALEPARYQAPAHQYRAEEPVYCQPAIQVNPGWEQDFSAPIQGQFLNQPPVQVNPGWEPIFDYAAQGQVFDQPNTLVNPWQQPNFDMGSLPQANSQPEGSQNLALSHHNGHNGYSVFDATDVENLGQQVFDASSEVQGTPPTSLSSPDNFIDLTVNEVVPAAPNPLCRLSERKKYLSMAVKEGSPGFPWLQSFLMAKATHQRAHCAKYWPTNEAAYEDVKYACDKFASFVEARLEYMRWDSLADDPPLVPDGEGNFSLKTPEAIKKAREEDEEQLKKKLLESKKHVFSFDSAARKRKRSSGLNAPAAKKQEREEEQEQKTPPAEIKEAKTVGELSKHNLKELKAYLRGEKRPVKGSKAELVERVRVYLGFPEQGPAPSPGPRVHEAEPGSMGNEMEGNASEMETEAASASNYQDALRQLFPQGFQSQGSGGLEESESEESDEE